MIVRVLESTGPKPKPRRKKNGKYESTCDLALGVIDFVMRSHPWERSKYEAFLDRLPGALEILAKGSAPYQSIAAKMKENLPQKLLKTIADYRDSTTGEING